MAFILKNFQPLGANARGGFLDPGGSSTMQGWSYEHPTDSIATIIAAGYFNDVRVLVQTKDILYLNPAGASAFQIHFFNVVPKEPLTTNVTLNALKMVAT